MTTIAVYGGFAAIPILDDLRAALPQATVVPLGSDGPVAAARDADVAIGSPSADRVRALLRECPRLRWVHTVSAGVERLLIPELLERDDVLLTNNTGAYDVPIAEHVMAMLFAIAKRVPHHLAAQSRHQWQRDPGHAELRDASLVILGMGSIGGELARLASGVGMRVTGIRRHLPNGTAREAPRIVGSDALPDVAAEADYLAITAALTAQTRGMVSADVIARMRPTAWLVNIARGAIVDEEALLAACRDGRIGGAALDVFSSEPLPADSAWWDLPNAIITPHVSNSSPRVQERTLALFVENVRRFQRGEQLLNLVDKRVGY
ncbi:MAG: D-2-hydroxyacid dehydrogenase [Chloroflexota bacterium]|nr:D-2-hydroxyacid dehydrogenase [Chloroflexota bacterium]